MLHWVKTHYKNKHQLYNWLATYLIILVISVSVSSCMYFFYSHVLIEEIEKTTEGSLDQIKSVIEAKLKNIENMGYNLLYASSVNNLISSPYYNFTDEKVNEWTRNAISDIKYNSNNEFAANCIIVFKDIDSAIDGSGKYSKKKAYEIMFEQYFESEDEWLRFLFLPHINDYRILEGKNGSRIAVYMQSYPLSRVSEPLAVNIVILDTAAINKYANNMNGIQAVKVYVLDESGQEIVGDGSWDTLEIDLNKNGSSTENIKAENNDTVVLHKKGSSNNWQYMLAIPKSSYLQRVRNVGLLTIVIHIICILLGIAFALYFSLKNYRPMENIISKLYPQISGNLSGESEFSYIDKAITMILEDRNLAKDELRKHNNSGQSLFLNKLLKKRFNDENLVKKFEQYNIECGDYYQVVLFNIMGFGVIESDYNMAHFLIANVFEEIMNEYANCYFTEADDVYACLVVHKTGGCNTKEKAEICVEFLIKHLGLELVCAISDLSDKINGIPVLYGQAMEVMSYFFIKNDKMVLTYQDTQQPAGAIYNYTIQTEKKLLNSMLIGDYEDVKKVLDEVLNENLYVDTLDINMAKMLIYEIGNTVLKALRETSENKNIIIDEEILMSGKLFEFKTIEEIKAELDKMIYSLCKKIRNSAHIKSNNKMEQITNIIHTQYQDANLSVGRIAEMMGISINYLSKYFKEQMGKGSADYIVEYRVEKAKELLKSTDLKISEVGTETGFYNTNVFIRAFKKVEGITPGQYKSKYNR